ncbi:response regulator transcription factor [Streptomyces rubradiris]|uniref:DNA-binding response regulator n=1 Tax=Streptomyces rubradiris TaxID=285531 RepID=A0ABQ3RQZ3_STRRR|nr:response regulator transcription factor [Streptomyces rubradiris]GHH24596.1 DNA-binding response regulator [Streptomyces rubradiris]GHI58286.1 DNA-binding response regulator [Streptomyces rubradiris]
MGIDVLVSDDRRLSRFALAALLERHEGVRVVGSAESNLAALKFAEQHRPDVSIISFEDGDGEALSTAEKIADIGCRSMLLATAVTRSVVRQAFASRISGIVERSVSPRQFVEAIHRVHQGDRVFDAELTVAALNNSDCPLNRREFTVLEYVARGDTVTEIAAGMHLSQGTVRNYISSMVAKLGARNRIDALRIARDSRWI